MSTSTAASVPSFSSYGGTAPENYEQYFVPAIGRPLAEDLVSRAHLVAGERIVDVACGTGIVARIAADKVGPDGAVNAVDMNPGMLAVARATSPGRAPVSWHEADATSLPLDDGSHDVVFCQLGLQFFPDKVAALREAHRVLAPGGRILVNVPGSEPELFEALARALADHVSDQAAGFVHVVFSLHKTDELQRLIAEAGFSSVEATSSIMTLRLPDPTAFLWQYVHATPLVSTIAGLDNEQRAAIEHDVVSDWQRHVTSDGSMQLHLPMTSAVGRR
jgi:ubiquinone/menaquinone biosynthesis C-methylase UbiE